MRWYLNPLTLARVGRGAHDLMAAGGPASLRLQGVGRSTGWIVPAVPIHLELVGRDGSVIALEPEVPLPVGLGWSYRIAELLGIPPFERAG